MFGFPFCIVQTKKRADSRFGTTYSYKVIKGNDLDDQHYGESDCRGADESCHLDFGKSFQDWSWRSWRTCPRICSKWQKGLLMI